MSVTKSVYLPEDLAKQVEASGRTPRELIELGLSATESLAEKVETRCDAIVRLLEHGDDGQSKPRVYLAIEKVVAAAGRFLEPDEAVSGDHASD